MIDRSSNCGGEFFDVDDSLIDRTSIFVKEGSGGSIVGFFDCNSNFGGVADGGIVNGDCRECSSNDCSSRGGNSSNGGSDSDEDRNDDNKD